MSLHKSCPSCSSTQIDQVNSISDHFLSHENFSIYLCNNCNLLFTNPIPELSELGKYYQSDEYLSHTSSQKGIIPLIYRLIRNYSLVKKYQIVTKQVSSGSLLDIGCGTGEFINFFANKNWDVTGVEPSENARSFAINNYNLPVHNEDFLLNIENNKYDVISMWHVLEHVSDLTTRINQVKNGLKKDGLLVVALPNHQSFDAQHYGNYWAAWDVPRHLYHFSKSSFGHLLQLHNFEIMSILPMKFDSFYVSMLSEKYQNGKGNLLSAFLNGIRSNIHARRNNGNYSSLIYLIKNKRA